ncbi:2-phospho-L-lactate guanylyltransferase [Halobacteriaceae archaeon GCM10025711]
MRVVVPFDATDPKSRLAPVLDGDERRAFADAMLRDVLDAVRAAGHTPEVVATASVNVDAPVTVDERPLTPCVNAVLDAAREPVAVVMADLALATSGTLARLFATDGDVVLVPGRGGGTNAFVARHDGFRVDYHGTSFLDHREAAADAGADVTVVDSYRLSTDVDDPDDLAEVLLHADGRAARWLRDAGFRLSTTGGRVAATRE